jgi:predicted RNA-binding Zn ribbon-like protein
MTGSAPSPTVDLETTVDFINTFGLSRGRPFDDFDTTRAALDWLHQRTGLEPAEVVESDAALARVALARNALRELWDALAEGRPPAVGAVEEVNRVLRHRSLLELQAAPSESDACGLRLASRFTGDEIDCALAELAEPLVKAVGSGSAEHARICANETCRWVFFDASRTHQRRWCEMASCGNRAKAARHRARVRAEVDARA